LLRLFYLRCEFFWGGQSIGWNLFDLLIVGTGLVDTMVDFCGAACDSEQFDFINEGMKMLRLLRILRLLRLFRMFKQLYLLASGLVDSCVAVFWVTMLCALFLYTCSIALTQLLRPGTGNMTAEAKAFCEEKFGSVMSSMMTLFDIMASPNFGLLSSIFAANPGIVLFFVFFTVFGSFTMISILTGVISEAMMEKSSNRKEEEMVLEQMRKKQFVDHLRQYFVESDKDGSGTVARDEFDGALPELTKMFAEEGFAYTADDLALVFDLIDYDNGGTIELSEFLDGMASFTANVSDLPMHILRLQCNMRQTAGSTENRIISRMKEVEVTMLARIQAVEEGLHAKIDKLIAAR